MSAINRSSRVRARAKLSLRSAVLVEFLERRTLLSGGSIVGFVYNDSNQNGTIDTGEQGTAGVTMTLAPQPVGTALTTQTSFAGGYSFTNVPAGTYLLTEQAPDPYLSDIRSQSVTVVAGQSTTAPMFSVRPGGSGDQIAGTVYNDFNYTGQIQPNEPGLPGVTLYFITSDSPYTPKPSDVVTDSQGHFLFSGLAPGTYHFADHPLLGNERTYPADTPPGPLGVGYTVTLGARQFISERDFAETALPDNCTISGTVFVDVSGLGTYTQGYPGIASVPVFLDTNYNGVPDPGEPSTTTSASGQFTFSNLPIGEYYPYALVGSNYVQTTPKYGKTFEVSASENGTVRADIGEIPLADTLTVTGKVFDDYNANGQYDSYEPGMQGARVYDDANGNGQWDSNEPSVLTDADGNYALPGVIPYGNNIQIVNQPGRTVTKLRLDPDVNWFASELTGSGLYIGTIFNDSNGNGIEDPGEATLPFEKVYLDLNDNGIQDPLDPTSVTDSKGLCDFTFVHAGTYVIRMAALPPGWAQTYPAGNGAQVVSIPSNQLVSGIAFGLVQTASISGNVFNDLNGNGIDETGETGLGGASVFIDSNNDGSYDTGDIIATADADGNYTFSGLLPGSYSVRLLPESGWTQISPAAGAFQVVTVAAGDNVTNVAFAEAQSNASISGTYFYDTNGNGIWDSGEAISPSWGVFLDTNGDGIYESGEPELICNSQGQYTFTNLLPGTYRVHPTSAAKWTETAPPGGTQIINAISGQTTANVNFGEVKGAARTSATPTALFTGESYLVNLSYAGFHSVTSWTINWGDGTGPQTITGSPASASHTFTSASGNSPFTILAWANTVDGDAPALPLTLAVYAAPLLNNGLLSLAGTSGNDSVSFTNSGGLLTLNLDGAIAQYNSSAVTKLSYTDPGGNDTINLTGAIPATLNLASGNSTITNSDSAPVYVATGLGKTTINALSGTTIIPANPGTGIQELEYAAINISAGAKVLFANSSATLGDYSHHASRSVAVVDAGGLNIATGGTLDMGDNDLILNYAPANEAAAKTQVFNLLASGITANGDWSGTGLTSSEAAFDTNVTGTRALGMLDNADSGYGSFDGVGLSGSNQILVKFTYYGDADLTGTMDGTDLSQYFAGRSHQGTGWDFADFDHDGTTGTSTDLTLYLAGANGYKQFGAL